MFTWITFLLGMSSLEKTLGIMHINNVYIYRYAWSIIAILIELIKKLFASKKLLLLSGSNNNKKICIHNKGQFGIVYYENNIYFT